MSLFGDLRDPWDIDAIVRLRLSSSLAHVFQRAKGRLDVDATRLEAALKLWQLGHRSKKIEEI